MRLGIDLGGTKIAAVVLGARRRACCWERARRRRRATTTTARSTRIAALVDGRRARGRRAVHGRHRHARRDLAGDRSGQERQLDLAERPAASDRISSARLGAAGPRSPTTRTAWPCRKRPTARRPARDVVFGVILGTGTGGGLVVDGRVVTGANAIAGEWGHNPLPWPERRRAAGPGVLLRPARLHRDVSVRSRAWPPTTARRGGTASRGEDVVARAARRRRRAPRAIARRLGVAPRASRWRPSSTSLDPDVIVVGGGLSRIAAALRRRAARAGRRWVFSDRVDTRLVPAKHGDASGVRGAAWLWRSAVLPSTVSECLPLRSAALRCPTRASRRCSDRSTKTSGTSNRRSA